MRIYGAISLAKNRGNMILKKKKKKKKHATNYGVPFYEPLRDQHGSPYLKIIIKFPDYYTCIKYPDFKVGHFSCQLKSQILGVSKFCVLEHFDHYPQ